MNNSSQPSDLFYLRCDLHGSTFSNVKAKAAINDHFYYPFTSFLFFPFLYYWIDH